MRFVYLMLIDLKLFMSMRIYVNSRPLKSTHLRDIARKQCPADFFNK